MREPVLPDGFALPDRPEDVTGEVPDDVRAVLVAAAEDRALWEAWTTTEADLLLPDMRAMRLVPALGPQEFPLGYDLLHVLTSCNPAGREQPMEENIRRLGVLRALLELRKVPHWPATGHDPAVTWQEPGFMIAGLSDGAARELGAAMGQVAVFAWTPRSWSIVASLTDRRVELPWSLHPR